MAFIIMAGGEKGPLYKPTGHKTKALIPIHGKPMIEIRQLTKSLHGGGHRVDILTGIDLTIPDGQFVAVTGPSGSGKTTLLFAIAGMITPTSGSVTVEDVNVSELGGSRRALFRAQRLGFVYQMFYLVPYLTALERGAELSREVARG